jgi:hypothetical protein
MGGWWGPGSGVGPGGEGPGAWLNVPSLAPSGEKPVRSADNVPIEPSVASRGLKPPLSGANIPRDPQKPSVGTFTAANRPDSCAHDEVRPPVV